MLRKVVRIVLIIAAAISIAAIIASIIILGPDEVESWAVIAAALAVITSIISSWPAQRVLELQEDSQLPYPYPSIDVRSRYGLMQLRVTNYGESRAQNINLFWDKPLLNRKGEQAKFSNQKDAPEIPVLLPKESVAVLIGGSMNIYSENEDMNYTGRIEFEDASGKHYVQSFFLSAETYRSTLVHEEEAPKTHHEIQKIPDELTKLRRELIKINHLLQQSVELNQE